MSSILTSHVRSPFVCLTTTASSRSELQLQKPFKHSTWSGSHLETRTLLPVVTWVMQAPLAAALRGDVHAGAFFTSVTLSTLAAALLELRDIRIEHDNTSEWRENER